jgi:hypothetical protein
MKAEVTKHSQHAKPLAGRLNARINVIRHKILGRTIADRQSSSPQRNNQL